MASAVYLVLASCMFYFTGATITVGGIGFMYRYLLGIFIVIIAFFAFMVRPRLRRLVLLMKYSLVLALPYLLVLLFSFGLWILRLESFRFMLRGSFYVGYVLLAVFVAAATVYLFGRKGIWHCLAAALIAYSIHITQVVLEGGPGEFMRQFAALVTSFGNDTGTMMRELELHTFVFALWTFLLYLLAAAKTAGHKLQWCFITAVTLLFALVGFKRIAVLGILCAVVIERGLSILPETAARRGAKLIGYGLITAAFLYIVAVHMGLFTYLEEEWNVDTNTRSEIYRYLNTQYEINPFYMGKGVAFDSKPWDMSAVTDLTIRQNAYHNDFLRMYIELGFIGFLIWGWLCFVYQPGYFFKRQGKQGGLFYFAYCVYNAVLYTTDNTVYYYYGSLVIFLLAMSYRVEELEKEELPYYEADPEEMEEWNQEQPGLQESARNRETASLEDWTQAG